MASAAVTVRPVDAATQPPTAAAPGLTAAEAAARLARDGPNTFELGQRRTTLRILAGQFTSPLVAILIVAAAIAGFVGERVEAAIILAMVALSAALGFVQEARSAAALEALQARVAPRARVVRNGQETTVPAREVVRDDVLVLAAGMLVAADARLVAANHLYMDEAVLTGESGPVAKGGEADEPARAPASGLADPSALHAGTSVVSGEGRALVTATGRATRYGQIADRLAQRAPRTDFQRGVRDFGLLITRVILVLVLAVLTINVALGRPAIDSLLFAVALAVGLTPELLPAIVTLNLTRGARALEPAGVLVKRLPALQDLGAVTVLCTDKTGTLTSGELVLDAAVDAAGRPAARALELARLNSRLQAGFSNPLDGAILAAPEPARSVLPRGLVKRAELPFDFQRRCLSIVAAGPGGALLVTKGAPDSVLARCTRVRDGKQPKPLDPATRKAISALAGAAGDRGQRSIGVASRALAPAEAGAGHGAPALEGLEAKLVFEGLLTFADPPKADVAATLVELRRLGVVLKIVTGDDERVARRIAELVGLPVVDVLTGAQLERLSHPALVARALRTTIFARVDPDQKLRVVGALREAGAVVGYLGDGINDAPPLHVADVGISVDNATEVARAAADVILLRPSLAAIARGIIEGRRTFANTLKYIRMGTSSNFGNMLSMAAASLLLPFLPMLPGQILLNNLIYDLSQTSIPTDLIDEEITTEPGRWDVDAIRRFMLFFGPVSSIFDLATFGLLLVFLHVGEGSFQAGWFIESLCTQVLVVLAIRTRRVPFWRSRPSGALLGTVLLAVAVGIVIPLTPLAGPLGFGALPPVFWPLLVLLVVAYLGLVEVAKGRLVRVARRGAVAARA